MMVVLLVYIGGVLSILSPCILPVIPFVFARGDQPFVHSGLPLLLGMAMTFAGVASLAAVAGGWAVDASQYGRYVALAVLALFALTMMSDRLATFLTRPAVVIGDRLSGSLGKTIGRSSFAASFVIGVATGFLWAPCAGPILGLVLATVALKGASVGTALLLFAYAAGAATSLAGALLASARVFSAIKRYLATGVLIRRGLGAAVLAAVAATATGLDTDILANVATIDTTPIEQSLIWTFGISARHRTAEPVGATAVDRRSPNQPVERFLWRNLDPGSLHRHDARRFIRHRAGCSRRPRERRQPAESRGRDRMDQFAAVVGRIAARQGRARQCLDLCLHQLPPRSALREGLGGQISQRRSRGRGRPYARAGLRAPHLERASGRAELRHQIPGRGRHQFDDLEQLLQ